MSPQEIVDTAKEYAAEYIEMEDDPYRIVSYLLAHKVEQLVSYIEYLERLCKR